MRFKERELFRNTEVQGKAASTDTDMTANYPEAIAEIINKGSYTKQQSFNADETAFCWKKMPSNSFITREEKSVPGFRASKDRLTFLLGAYAAGDFRLKPVLSTPEILGLFRIMHILLCLCSINLATGTGG